MNLIHKHVLKHEKGALETLSVADWQRFNVCTEALTVADWQQWAICIETHTVADWQRLLFTFFLLNCFI